MDWHKYVTYNNETGGLVWKERDENICPHYRCRMSWNSRFAGKNAGLLEPCGYVRIIILGKHFKAHRIIWEMNNGPIPNNLHIDHADGNKTNNRLSNLRLATRSQNNQNAKLRKTNLLRIKGVSINRNGFQAVIYVNKKYIYLGTFRTKGLAAVARAKAAIKYHGKFARLT